MACSCGVCFSCLDRRRKTSFSQVTRTNARCTLANELSCLVDDLRDIATDLGFRPYVVRLIWTQWSGGRFGHGVEQIVQTEDLLPTPKVESLDPLDTEILPIGAEETGSITVSEISPRYTEDFLSGVFSQQLSAGTPGIQFFWEVEQVLPNQSGEKRRFTLDRPPSYEATKLQWSVKLIRAYANRARNGDLRGG